MRARILGVVFLFAACGTGPQLAPTPGAIGFDGAIDGWRMDSTGGNGPNASWLASADPTAISRPNVMRLVTPNHSSEERFNLCWHPGLTFRDGSISVAVRADSGEVDQGGGPMWRVRDTDNYYVCRYNPLESNYRVYVVHNGMRRQLATAIVETDGTGWHRLAVEHTGSHIRCLFDGAVMLEVEDNTIDSAGGVGLWTKADACTSFDDLGVVGRSR